MENKNKSPHHGDCNFCTNKCLDPSSETCSTCGILGLNFQEINTRRLQKVKVHAASGPNVVKGTYTSVWDGNIQLDSPCIVDLQTKRIEVQGSYDLDVEVLESEYVTIAGHQYSVCQEEDYEGKGFYY